MPRMIKNMAAKFEAATAASKTAKAAVDPMVKLKELKLTQLGEAEINGGFYLPVPKGETPKSFMAKVRGAIVSATYPDRCWAGKAFSIKIDPAAEAGKEQLMLMRVADPEVAKVKRKGAGGRPKGSGKKAGEPEAVAGLTSARSHLGGSADGKVANPPKPDNDKGEDGVTDLTISGGEATATA